MNTRIDSPNRREFLKGLAVGAGGYALGSLLIYPKEAMGQSIQGYLEKVPVEARWDIASGAFIAYTVNYFKVLYDQGDKEKFVESFKERGRRAGAGYKGLADRFGFTGNDAKSAAAIIPAIVTLSFGPQQKCEIEEATAEKARVKCTNCTFWNAAQGMKITDDLCSAWSQYAWEGRAKAINPKLTSTLVKARPRGDSVCEWVIELKT
ncbi:MAG: twin-arginine translocation signal domain-containing protein [Deltaproteobacteria bacterium]|nr:twin-arginine translocation signal domain-containing protein [Deltaproteobacteria bacterium]